MFDHVVISVSDYAASKAFFEQTLAPLGVGVVAENQLGVELCRPDGVSSLCIRLQPVADHPHLHLAFTAENRQQVEAFHRAALAVGGKDNGAGPPPEISRQPLRRLRDRPGRPQHRSGLP